MSSFFLLDNVVCPAFPTKAGGNGHPVAFSYVQNLSGTGGDSGTKLETTGDNCCRCPDDDGDSWDVTDANDAARGAFIYLEVSKPGDVDLVEVNNRLHKCKANQDRVLRPQP